MQIVDRRLNPKSKSLGNRQRFLRRAKAEIREAIKDSLKSRKVSEAEGSEKVTIRSKSLREPSFSLGRNTGSRDYVLPGNEEYQVGDEIPKPQGGGGGRGSQGVTDGEGQDEFTFTLTKEEFLDLFFDDLKLPNLVKVKLKDLKAPKVARAGFTMDGSPARLNHARTMRKSLGRRIALRRPIAGRDRAARGRAGGRRGGERRLTTPRSRQLRAKLEHKQRLRRGIAYIDPIDLQYNRFERVPKPTTQAVMFCLMDASASMTEPLKDLAKRFFMLLHVFLSRYYREVHIVFIRHTSTAAEVDEETFFRSTDTGGTVISTRARRDAEGGARALFAVRLEHLRGAGLRRRQLPRRHAALPGAARRGDSAALPVFRLHRDHARRALQRHGGDARLARLLRRSPGAARTSPCAAWRRRRTSSRCSTTCSRRTASRL